METKLESEGKSGTWEQETGEHPERERSLLLEATAVPPTPAPVKEELPRWEGAGPSRDPKFNCALVPSGPPILPTEVRDAQEFVFFISFQESRSQPGPGGYS